jgi:DNA-binding IclR family transcriptional regulator
MNTLTLERPNASLAEIATATGLDKSTTHRLLGALERHGLVRRDAATKRYSLGATTMTWGAVALSSIEVRAIAEPVLRRLNVETRETVSLWVREDDWRVCIWALDSPQVVRHVLQLGLRIPITNGSGGKLTLALLPQAEALSLLDADRGLSDERRTRIIAELPEIRRLGYAVSIRQVTSNAWSMAAPILDSSGNPIATIVIAGPSDRLDDALVQRIAAMLVPAAREVSQQLGAATRTPAGFSVDPRS